MQHIEKRQTSRRQGVGLIKLSCWRQMVKMVRRGGGLLMIILVFKMQNQTLFFFFFFFSKMMTYYLFLVGRNHPLFSPVFSLLKNLSLSTMDPLEDIHSIYNFQEQLTLPDGLLLLCMDIRIIEQLYIPLSTHITPLLEINYVRQ